MLVEERATEHATGVEFLLEQRIQRTAAGRGGPAWVALFDGELSSARWLARALGKPSARTLRQLIEHGAFVVTDQRDWVVGMDQPEPVSGARYRWTLRRDGDELALTVHCTIEDEAEFARNDTRSGKLQRWLRQRLLRDAAAKVRPRRVR
jgi:hypothetical protein